MWKIVVAAGIALTMSGCTKGMWQRQVAHWQGYAKVCVEGVNYIQFPTGAAVQRDRTDHIVACD